MMSCDIKILYALSLLVVMKYENLNPQSNVACEGIK